MAMTNTPHRITMDVDKGSYLKSSETFRITDAGTHWDTCSVCLIPEGQEGRQVCQGPMVPGPWQFTTTHAHVIDNSGIAAAAYKAARVIPSGEPVAVDGLPGVWMFVANDQRKLEGDGVKLVPYVEAS
jgi:hypothetical protein